MQEIPRISRLEHGLIPNNIHLSHRNDLLEWVISANLVAIFELRLDKFWEGQKQKFNYQAQINTTHSQVQCIEAAVLEPQAH